MVDWIYEDPRLTPETQQMLSQLPLTKAFLGRYLNPEIWAAHIASELKNIRSRFEGNEKAYDAITQTSAFFALNSRVVNTRLSNEVIIGIQEILIALGFEAFLKKVDIKKYGPISNLIISKLIEMGVINKDPLIEHRKKILEWYDTSWKIGYYLLPSIISQSPLEDKTTNQPPQPDKPTDSGDLNLGPFADFINSLEF
jgi:hypothetical protein